MAMTVVFDIRTPIEMAFASTISFLTYFKPMRLMQIFKGKQKRKNGGKSFVRSQVIRSSISSLSFFFFGEGTPRCWVVFTCETEAH